MNMLFTWLNILENSVWFTRNWQRMAPLIIRRWMPLRRRSSIRSTGFTEQKDYTSVLRTVRPR